jgi:hypothetical protein
MIGISIFCFYYRRKLACEKESLTEEFMFGLPDKISDHTGTAESGDALVASSMHA